MSFHRRWSDGTAALLTLVIGITLPTFAQVQPAGDPTTAQATGRRSESAAGKLAFEAASVRHSTQESLLKGVEFLNPASDAAPPPGGLFSWNVQLPWMINFAYDLRSSQTRRAAREALPKWAQESWFAVEARAEGSPSRDDVRQMVRTLLEERFQFSAHIEKREGQVYALVVEQQGLGLKPHAEGAPCTISSSTADEKKYPHLNPPYEAVPAHCGIFARELSQGGEHRLEMLNVTMQQIAAALGLGLPLCVTDQTRLPGKYDAVIDFGPDTVDPSASSSDAIGLPPLPGALEKQAGLKLVKQKAQIETFVIDHIAELSEN
jgi:uncharacterized protein (TIGR03435 family)